MRLRIAVMVAALAAHGAVAHGAGIPVMDASNFAQNQLQAVESIKQTLKQIEEYQKQLEQLQEQLRNGMGFEDIMGQFKDLFGQFQNMQNGFNLDSGSVLGQMEGFRGGSIDSSNYFQNGSGGSSYFSYQSPGGGGIDNRAIYGSPRDFYNMRQDEIRPYMTVGAEQQNAANDEWMNALLEQRKQLEKEVNEDMAKLQRMIQEAGDDESGGTNKLLGVTNALLLKLVQQNMALHHMMITRETAESVYYKNMAARQQDMEAQSIRLRQPAESFQRQGTGMKPLKWQ